ncbi:MAG: SpaA isopeptide-forming pilin-related protein, partial [Oscillospiraceae bacterium]
KDIFKETISDANGVVSFDNIPEGKYSLIEVSAPKGYELTQKIVSIDVDKKGAISDNIIASLQNAFVNSSTKSTDIEFTKYGRNSGDTNEDYYWTQGGATFGLYEGYNANGKLIKTTVSSGDGVVKFDGLKGSIRGKEYSIKEISAPDGYIKSEKIINFKVGLAGVIWNDKGLIIGSDLNVGKSFVNERIPLGNLSFTKKAFFQPDKSEKDGIWNLAGAKFNLSGTMVYEGANGKAYNKDIISTKAGLVELKEIPAGEYVLREITAPDGYTASTAQISVSVSKETGKTTFKKDGKEIQLVDLEQAFENEFIEIKGGFSINKTGRYMGLEATPLNNVRFALYNDKGELVGEETSTNANGVVDFKNISDGTYTLREFLPEGYTAAEGKTVTKYNGSDVVEYTVLVNGRTGETKIDGKVYTIANPIKIINQQIAKKGNFNVEKIKAYLGTDKGTLAGVTFTLKQGDVTIQEKVTDGDGFAAFVDLESGNYKLIETVPNGYTAKQKEYDVFV